VKCSAAARTRRTGSKVRLSRPKNAIDHRAAERYYTQKSWSAKQNPGVVICFAPDEVIHAALQHQLTPVAVLQRGIDATTSAATFKQFVHRVVLETPSVDVEEHCVIERVDANGRTYFPHLFHRLSQDTYFDIVRRLQRVFVTDNTALAQWSVAVSAPPAPPLAKIVRVGGGAGCGSIFMNVEPFGAGMFRH
jgi:hypothetical protein